MRIASTLLCAALLAGASRSTAAQSCTTTQGNAPQNRTCDVSVTVGTWSVNKLGTMTISSTATVGLGSPSAADYDANLKVEPSANSRALTVSANAPWDLRATPATILNPAYWTAVNDLTYGLFVGAATDKPASDLQIGTTYSSTGAGYIPLATDNATSVAILVGQSPAAARTVNVYWATVWYYQFDTPGRYTLPFTLSLQLN
jgi:hypothetical protein